MARNAITAILFLFTISLTSSADELQRAIELFREGKDREAEEIFRALVKQNPSNGEALFYIGRIIFNAKEYDESSDWFEKAIEVDPNNSRYHLWLGRAYGLDAMNASIFRKPFLAGKVKEQFLRAVELDPASVEARLDLMEYYRQAPGIMGGSTEKAMEQAEEIKKHNTYHGHLAVGRMKEELKDSGSAIREYRQAIASFPDSGSPYYRLGNLLIGQGKSNEALDLFEKFLKDRPNDMRAHYQLGRLAAISGQLLDAGEESLKKFLAHTPPQPPSSLSAAHWRLGMIYELKGEKELARKEYETGAAVDPDRKEIKEALKKLK